MGAAVHFEDVIVEALNPEAEARHPDLAQGLELFLGEGARLGLEGDFLGLVPGEEILHPVGQIPELLDREVAGRAPAEIDELRLPAREVGGAGITFELADPGIEIGVDLRGVLVGVNAEVAEVAAFPAEGYVEVDSEIRVGRTGRVQNLVDGVLVFRLPEGEGRIIRNEVVARLGLLGRGCVERHLQFVNDTGREGGFGRRSHGKEFGISDFGFRIGDPSLLTSQKHTPPRLRRKPRGSRAMPPERL